MELCAEIVSIWIDIAEVTLYDEECLICMGDITTAIGWLQKSHKPAPDEHKHLTLAKTRIQRQLADLVIYNEHLLYS